jgi:hypothetical protein
MNALSDRRALITGQDGSYLVEFLLGKGYAVYGILRRSSSFNTSKIDPIYQNPHALDRRLRLIDLLENPFVKKAEKRFLPMQPGDVPATYADAGDLIKDADFKPDTPIEVGIQRLVEWYREYCCPGGYSGMR